MSDIAHPIEAEPRGIRSHLKIIWALLLRELATRFGRDNIGFLWIIGEPLIFTFGVIVMWSLIRPKYEHGVYVVPFVLTGYSPLLLLRHNISQGLGCVRANNGLLYHRRITILHMFIARVLLESLGVTASFTFATVTLCLFGQMDPPASMGLIYGGWMILTLISFGLTLIFGSIAAIYDVFEKIAQLLTYIMIPMTGSFYMIEWIPPQFRQDVLLIPLINCTEMIRAGFFGPNIPTYYHPMYALAWGVGLTFLGLLMAQIIRDKVEVD